MSSSEQTNPAPVFGTVINCMDGRVQEPVAAWMKKRYGVDYVDTITEAGPDKVLADAFGTLVSNIRARVEISVNRHGSKVIAIAAHHDCAGNPVSPEQHHEHIREAVTLVREWDYPAEVLGLWVDEQWRVHPVEE